MEDAIWTSWDQIIYPITVRFNEFVDYLNDRLFSGEMKWTWNRAKYGYRGFI